MEDVLDAFIHEMAFANSEVNYVVLVVTVLNVAVLVMVMYFLDNVLDVVIRDLVNFNNVIVVVVVIDMNISIYVKDFPFVVSYDVVKVIDKRILLEIRQVDVL